MSRSVKPTRVLGPTPESMPHLYTQQQIWDYKQKKYAPTAGWFNNADELGAAPVGSILFDANGSVFVQKKRSTLRYIACKLLGRATQIAYPVCVFAPPAPQNDGPHERESYRCSRS